MYKKKLAPQGELFYVRYMLLVEIFFFLGFFFGLFGLFI